MLSQMGCSGRSRQSPAHHRRRLRQVCCLVSMHSAACTGEPQSYFTRASRVWPACSYFGCSTCTGVPTVDDFSAHGQQEGLSCPHSGLVPTALQC